MKCEYHISNVNITFSLYNPIKNKYTVNYYYYKYINYINNLNSLNTA